MVQRFVTSTLLILAASQFVGVARCQQFTITSESCALDQSRTNISITASGTASGPQGTTFGLGDTWAGSPVQYPTNLFSTFLSCGSWQGLPYASGLQGIYACQDNNGLSTNWSAAHSLTFALPFNGSVGATVIPYFNGISFPFSGPDVSCNVCPISLAPLAETFQAQGGLGSFTVTTGANCKWIATTPDSWITPFRGPFYCPAIAGLNCPPPPPSGTGTFQFAVASNSTTAARTGSISVGGQTFTINQLGISADCTFTVNPTQNTLTGSGGNVSVRVIASSPACSWTAEVNGYPWLTVTSGTSGVGSGFVTLHAASSPAQVTGYATIAGQSVQVTESPSANCGATDVSGVITVSGFGWNPIWNPPGVLNRSFGMTFEVANGLSPAVVPQVSVVFLHLPIPGGAVYGPGVYSTSCYSPQGNVAVPVGNLPFGQFATFGLTIYDPNPIQFPFPPDLSTVQISGTLTK
jgi:hypothetical protein